MTRPDPFPRRVVPLEHIRLRTERPGFDRVRLRYERYDGSLSDTLDRLVVGVGCRSVSVLAWDESIDRVVLIEQFRAGAWLAATDSASPAPVSPWMLEVVAGDVEPGEDPVDAARRELLEEASCEAKHLIHVASFCPDPETSAAAMTLYATRTRAPKCMSVRGNLDEQEDLRLGLLSTEEIEAELALGSRVANAATLIALNWFLRCGRAALLSV